MNSILERSLLYNYNRLVLSWCDKELNEENLKIVKRIFERVVSSFQDEENQKLVLSSLEKFPIDLAQRVFSHSQIESKRWITEELSKLNIESLGNTYLLGGWCGLINRYLDSSLNCSASMVYSFDLDSDVQEYADILNSKEYRALTFKSIIKDIRELNYEADKVELHGGKVENISCDTVINTSCEHMDNSWLKSLPGGKLVIAQSNNHSTLEEHSFCSPSLKDFLGRLELNDVLYKGEIQLPEYKRFMVIGKK